MSEFTTAAFFKNIGAPGTTPTALDMVPDGVLSRASDTGLYVPAGMELLGAFGISDVSAPAVSPRLRINAASLLRVGYPYIRPLEKTIGVTNPNFQAVLDRPIRFPNNEVIGIDAVWEQGGGPAVDTYAVVFLRGQAAPLPKGDGFWVRGSGSLTPVAKRWSNLSNLVWEIAFSEGNYAVVGFEVIIPSASGLAARLIFPGSPWRPGTISIASTLSRTHAAFYEGHFGVFGQFASFAPPGIEVLCAAAVATNVEINLRVVKL